jgi:two-component system, OmpR family, phosphate regulon sensor histidine kinase PhoR
MLVGVEAWLVAMGAVVAFLVALAIAARGRVTIARIERAAGVPPAGDPVVTVSALRERAERLEADERAQAADRDRFVESLAQGVMTVDDGFEITAANAAAHGLLGRGPGTLIGRSLIEAFLDTQVESIAQAAREVGTATGEVRVADADGPRLMLRVRRAPSGSLWFVMEDVSELRRLQQIRAEFIDNLSHELRTPLTTVSLLAETLTREAETAGDALPPKMRDRIGKIEIETGHLVQMVNELLDLSRIESGGGLGVLDLLDLGQVATESSERLRLFADRQGVTLQVRVAGPIPPVRGDEARLGQVFVNLLHNAVKFSPDGGEVTVSVGTAGPDVVVSIADHGVGIPRGAQARIFERFYKVDRARVRGEAGGTGLGLAIARHIIEQHGGRIWVESAEGVGSTFSFSIPIASSPVGPPGSAGAHGPT